MRRKGRQLCWQLEPERAPWRPPPPRGYLQARPLVAQMVMVGGGIHPAAAGILGTIKVIMTTRACGWIWEEFQNPNTAPIAHRANSHFVFDNVSSGWRLAASFNLKIPGKPAYLLRSGSGRRSSLVTHALRLQRCPDASNLQH